MGQSTMRITLRILADSPAWWTSTQVPTAIPSGLPTEAGSAHCTMFSALIDALETHTCELSRLATLSTESNGPPQPQQATLSAPTARRTITQRRITGG